MFSRAYLARVRDKQMSTVSWNRTEMRLRQGPTAEAAAARFNNTHTHSHTHTHTYTQTGRKSPTRLCAPLTQLGANNTIVRRNGTAAPRKFDVRHRHDGGTRVKHECRSNWSMYDVRSAGTAPHRAASVLWVCECQYVCTSVSVIFANKLICCYSITRPCGNYQRDTKYERTDGRGRYQHFCFIVYQARSDNSFAGRFVLSVSLAQVATVRIPYRPAHPTTT